MAQRLCDYVAIVRLTTGNLVLLHPVSAGDDSFFLPCTYGYASTIRRAQGSSLSMGCLYFDHCYPPERGYGYVGASRFRSAEGLFQYGRLRRSDRRPVGRELPMEQVARGDSSLESGSDDGYNSAMEAAYGSDSDSDDFLRDPSEDEGYVSDYDEVWAPYVSSGPLERSHSMLDAYDDA